MAVLELIKHTHKELSKDRCMAEQLCKHSVHYREMKMQRTETVFGEMMMKRTGAGGYRWKPERMGLIHTLGIEKGARAGFIH